MPSQPPSPAHAPPIDAATVVIARDTRAGIEVLMLRKNSMILFGGMWVFPGGRVDAEDGAGATDALDAFRNAAKREAQEEAGIELSGCALKHFAHWLPPPIRPTRFSTHFFLTRAPEEMAEIAIDGAEITEHAWVMPSTALRWRHEGEIEIATPTFVTLDWLRRYGTVQQVLDSIEAPFEYHTHITQTPEGSIAFYHGDVAYDLLDPNMPGPRRRANMLKSGWWWEEHDGEGNGPWTEPVDFSL